MNKNIGNEYEGKFVELMSRNGWWCHLFAYKPEGQPCDVVALRDNVPLLIDVKHCSGSKFYFRNIQPNQRNCFEMAYRRGNTNCGFAIYFEERQSWRWIGYREVTNLESFGENGVGFDNTEEFSWN